MMLMMLMKVMMLKILVKLMLLKIHTRPWVFVLLVCVERKCTFMSVDVDIEDNFEDFFEIGDEDFVGCPMLQVRKQLPYAKAKCAVFRLQLLLIDVCCSVQSRSCCSLVATAALCHCMCSVRHT